MPRPDAFPIALTFDLDADTLWLARDPNSANKPIWLSQGRYGPKEGVPRILALLRHYDIRCTFFIPGLVIERYPDAARAIVADGHEVAHHSYSHRWLDGLSEPEERREMELGVTAIEKLTGRKPLGYRSPAAEFSEHTVDLMSEYGITYSSNMFDADSPYLLQNHGKPTNIIELPFAWALDDAPFFLYSSRIPGRVMFPPSAVLETWQLEFDGLAAEPDRVFVLAMHPQIIGRPSRIWLLERLIQHMRANPRTWFGRCDEIAERARPALVAPA
ncbi:MAG: polysaccharide deacetylase family protein [Chloroflexota bacterium]